MRLNEELLERAEEFFELINCGDQDIEIMEHMATLRRVLEQDIDGWTNCSDEVLGLVAKNCLGEIWDCMSDDQRKDDDLDEHYFDFLAVLNRFAPTIIDQGDELPDHEDDENEDYDEEYKDDYYEEEDEWD